MASFGPMSCRPVFLPIVQCPLVLMAIDVVPTGHRRMEDADRKMNNAPRTNSTF